jgi:hypothetical protein
MMKVDKQNWVYLKWEDKCGINLKDIEASVCNGVLQKFIFRVPEEALVPFKDISQIETLHSALSELLEYLKEGRVIDSVTFSKQRKLRPEGD